jgi:hypothetical protein
MHIPTGVDPIGDSGFAHPHQPVQQRAASYTHPASWVRRRLLD